MGLDNGWELLSKPQRRVGAGAFVVTPFTRLARTLKAHRDGILAAIYWGVSNSKLEGINNRIGVLKHRAYGFHSAAALIAMVFLCCSKLPVDLPI